MSVLIRWAEPEHAVTLEKLKELYEGGLKAAVIAEQLSEMTGVAVTRNSVISALRRYVHSYLGEPVAPGSKRRHRIFRNDGKPLAAKRKTKDKEEPYKPQCDAPVYYVAPPVEEKKPFIAVTELPEPIREGHFVVDAKTGKRLGTVVDVVCEGGIRPAYDPVDKIWYIDSPRFVGARTIRELLAKLPPGTVVHDYYPNGYRAGHEFNTKLSTRQGYFISPSRFPRS